MSNFVNWTKKEYFRDKSGSPLPKWYLSSAKHSALEHSRHFPTIRDLLTESGNAEFASGNEKAIRYDLVDGKVRIFLLEEAHPDASERLTYFGFRTDWRRIENSSCQETVGHYDDVVHTVTNVSKNLGFDIPSDFWNLISQSHFSQ